MTQATLLYLIAGLLFGCTPCVASQNNDAYAPKQQKNCITKRPTHHFQPLLEKGRPDGGSSFDIQYFKDVKSGKTWVGKCNINAYIGASNDEEYREALGLVIYRFFGIITPEFAVSVQPVAPSVQVLLPHGTSIPVGNKCYRVHVNRPCIHIMTQFLDGFSTCADAFKEDEQDEHKDEEKDDQKAAAITDHDSPFMRAYKLAAKKGQPFHLERNGKKYPLKGLGTMLAVANFIYDINCIGKSGGNLGYLIQGNHAQIVKIDPGMAFSFLANHTNKQFKHNPMDTKTFFGTDESATLGYSQLTPVDQQAFATMAKRILQTPRKTLKQLIYSVVVPGGWQKEMTGKLLDHLIARKSFFLAAFAPEIHDNLRKEIMEAKHRLLGTLVYQKRDQKQSKEQIAAYQKALAALRAWEAKVADNCLTKQKEQANNQAQKPSLVQDTFQLPVKEKRGLFTGRQKERAAMAAFFGAKRKQACAFQAITGVGGTGKTHLALHYAHACAEGAQWIPHRYDAILWFYAEVGLDSQFHALAKVWRKKDCKTAQEAVQFVYQALQQQNRTLLVFDNAQQSQEIAPYLPLQHQKGLLDILLTTRNPNLNLVHHSSATYITLEAFTKEEARAYTQKVLSSKKCSQQAMDALWDTVSGLPLALHHALQYIAQGQCTLSNYPARFAEHQLRLGVQTQESPVVTSVLLSVLTLREEHPIIEPLLVTAAYLAPEKMPIIDICIMVGAKQVDQQLKALVVLEKYGLLTLAAAGQTFDFHRLVQQVLREWHRSKKGQAGHEALLQNWIVYFAENLEYDDADLNAIHRIIPLIPHACAIAGANSPSAAIKKAQASLYFQIGYHQLAGVAHYDKAKRCYEKALKIQEQHYGVGHLETASTINNLGEVLRNQGDYASAKTYFQKALKIKAQHYGIDHLNTASTIENLVNVLFDQGDYVSVKTYLEKALKIKVQHYGPTHPETAIIMERLGVVLLKHNDYLSAKTYFQKALNIKEQHYGAAHPETAIMIERLALVLKNLGDHASAKQHYEKALSIKAQHYGPTHPSTAVTMDNLGTLLLKQGDYTAAKTYYEKALKIKAQYYGPTHPNTAITMENLGTVLLKQSDYPSAKLYYEKALVINKQHYGPTHPNTARTMMNLGNALLDLGDYTSAKLYYEKALVINAQHYGPTHPNTARAMESLGTVLAEQGDYPSAKIYYEKALKIEEKYYGPTHPSTVITIMNLGTVLRELGYYASAKIYYEKVLKITAPHYGDTHPVTGTTMHNLGNVLDNQGDYAAAKTYYEKALKIFAQHYGPTHPNTARTMDNLGNVLSNQGDYAAAKVYLEKALQIHVQYYGESHIETARIIGNLGLVCKNLGQYKKARECYQQHIKVFTKHYGPNHARTKHVKRNLTTLEEQLASKSPQKQPQLQQIAQRPEFCKSHLEKRLTLGQVDQLHSQFQPSEEKEDEVQQNDDQGSYCIVM